MTHAFSGTAALLMCVAAAACRSEPAADLETLEQRIHREFPEVPEMTTEQLAERLRRGEPRPWIVDVRAPTEYRVSHLPQARNVPLDELEPARLEELGATKDTEIVLYCSVGYRSAMAARRLLDAGFRKVFNLRGSIFAWANEERPLVNEHGPTDLVHPFDETWGRYLVAARRAPLPR